MYRVRIIYVIQILVNSIYSYTEVFFFQQNEMILELADK